MADIIVERKGEVEWIALNRPERMNAYDAAMAQELIAAVENAADAGVMTFMTGYQSMEGVPATANHWLLTEVLKNEWGFRGVLVTDWDNVGRLIREQKVAATYADAAIMAVRAGNDIMMTTPKFYEGALEAVRSGRLDEAEIDAACARLLALKLRMGLFENPAFAGGTLAVARAAADCPGFSVVGGGDSVAAVKQADLADRFADCFGRFAQALPGLLGNLLPEGLEPKQRAAELLGKSVVEFVGKQFPLALLQDQ